MIFDVKFTYSLGTYKTILIMEVIRCVVFFLVHFSKFFSSFHFKLWRYFFKKFSISETPFKHFNIMNFPVEKSFELSYFSQSLQNTLLNILKLRIFHDTEDEITTTTKGKNNEFQRIVPAYLARKKRFVTSQISQLL